MGASARQNSVGSAGYSTATSRARADFRNLLHQGRGCAHTIISAAPCSPRASLSRADELSIARALRAAGARREVVHRAMSNGAGARSRCVAELPPPERTAPACSHEEPRLDSVTGPRGASISADCTGSTRASAAIQADPAGRALRLRPLAASCLLWLVIALVKRFESLRPASLMAPATW